MRFLRHIARLRFFAIATALLLNGCAMQPPQPAIPADYGQPIEQEPAEAQAHKLMHNLLKDPDSAKWDCEPIARGSIGSSSLGATYYGYLLTCFINGKNSYGAYAGAQEYRFVFQNGALMRAGIFEGFTQRIVYER
jgi:hypothetical protein